MIDWTDFLWFCPSCSALQEGKPVHCDNCGHYITQSQHDKLLYELIEEGEAKG